MISSILFLPLILTLTHAGISRFHLSLNISGEFLTILRNPTGISATDAEWSRYKEVHNKEYLFKGEDDKRRKIYFETKEKIEQHNLKADLGLESYHMGLNEFSDLSTWEFRKLYAGTLGNLDFDAVEPKKLDNFDLNSLPTSVNWVQSGGVVGVKNQGACGSCWAFATAGALETLHFTKTKNLVSLSEQQILDCSSNSKYHNLGCNGGYPSRAAQYVKDTGGIVSENDYPYEFRQNYCRTNSKQYAAKCSGYVSSEAGNEFHLAWYLANNGTMAVIVNASNWQYYRNGVYGDYTCKYGNLNHAVLLVGYTQDYWIIKNSWGAGWGERGYMRLKRNINICGIANQAMIPY